MPQTSRRRANVITVLNLKGGVGKTHAVWLLSSVCQERSQRMLVLDTDQQGNFTSSFIAEPGERPGIERLFDPSSDQDAHPLIQRTAYAHIDLIPASAALAKYDLSHRQQWEQSDLQRSLVDPVAELRSQYDFIVFDCPPRLSVVSFAALCASDFVIIPLEAADWGAQGIIQVKAAIDIVRSRYNSKLHLLGYLVSRFRRARSFQQAYLRQLRTHFGPQTFDTVIPDLARFEQSVIRKIPIVKYAPSSEEATIARDFFDEVVARIEQVGRAGAGGSRSHVRQTADTATV